MTVTSLADEIWRDLEAPSTISVPSIVFWMANNLGLLNTRLELTVTLDAAGGLSDDCDVAAAAIFKKLFISNYWNRKVAAHAGAAAYTDGVLEVTEGDRTVRVVNRNEIAKTFLSLKRLADEELAVLIGQYRANKAKPIQVASDPTYDEIGAPLGLPPRLIYAYGRGEY